MRAGLKGMLVAVCVVNAACTTAPPAAQSTPRPRTDDRPTVLTPGQTLEQQQRVSQAYRELQQVLFENRQVELDYSNAQDEDKMARGRAEAARQTLDKATVARNAAKAKESAARKRYDDALNQ